MELHCKHVDLFGNCGNRYCPYIGPCDGLKHTEYEDEEVMLRAGPSAIGGGDYCASFETYERAKE